MLIEGSLCKSPGSKEEKKGKLFEIKKLKIQKKWNKSEDTLLLELAKKYNSKNWKNISNHFSNKSPLQCFSRYRRIRPGIIKGSWNKEDDKKIIELVNKYGKAWSKISRIMVFRNGKQIRDRYINILDPQIKRGKFTQEEDLMILKLLRKLGTKWATIAKYFENRTADMIKNRYHSAVKKNIKFLEDLECELENTDYINNNVSTVKLILGVLYSFQKGY
jgi:myb proto-oncogene protein